VGRRGKVHGALLARAAKSVKLERSRGQRIRGERILNLKSLVYDDATQNPSWKI
jgi:hypothetical protein